MKFNYLHLFKSSLFPNVRTKIKGDNDYWISVIENLGAELIQIIKSREHSREILLVNHPSFGRCILKISCPICEARQGLANMSIAEIIKSSNPGIFPRIFDISPSYTLEEYIDGKKFHLWLLSNNNYSSIEDYFSTLKSWSINNAGYLHNEVLKPNEIRFLCNRNIEKCLGQLKYLPRKRQLRAANMIRRKRKKFTKQIDWLWEAADGIQLSKSLMCGDMGTKNILVDSQSNQLYNIDYEHLSIGHYGFDAVYFLHSYATNSTQAEHLDALTDNLLTVEYLGGQEPNRFFKVFSDLLNEIGQTIFRYFPRR